MPYKDPEAQRAYQREYVRKNRAEYLDGKSCVVCGSTDRMEVDHIERATKVDHRIWSWAKARRAAELAKCQVLCHDHHLEKTVRESSRPTEVEHGTNTRYTLGCHCEPCCAAHTQAKREWRAARRAAGLPVT